MSRWFQNLCIRRKLNLVVFTTGCVALALASAVLTIFTTMDLRAQTAREISTLADAFGSNAAAALEFHNSQAAEEILAALRTDRRILVAAILARGGSQFAHYSQPGIAGDSPGLRPAGFYFEGGTLLVMRPILVGGERIGSILIRCSLQEAYGRMRRNLVVLVIMIAVSLLGSLLFTQRLQLTISGPLLALARTAREVSANKKYSVRAPPHGRDETGELIDAFNDMLAQIQMRDAELESHRERLEHQVADRTRELTGANQELAAARSGPRAWRA